MKAFLLSLLLVSTSFAQLPKLHTAEEYALSVGALTDPAKLATLKGKRAATPKLRRIMYWLRMAQTDGNDPGAIIEAGQKATRSDGTQRAKLLKGSLLRNLDILGKLGCLDVAGIGKLRTGNAPSITKGPYKGELATGDHIIPRSVVPELDNVLINLEFLPETLNQKKAAKIGDRQVQLARKWHKAGVLSEKGLKAVEAVHEKPPASAQGFVTLFNGKNLDGWTTREPNHSAWSVVDGVIDCNPRSDTPKNHDLWSKKEYGDFELWVDWRIKESPYVNRKARIILPDGSFKNDESGNLIAVTAPNTDSGVFLRGQHKSQVNIWCWPVGSGEVWGYRTDPALSAKVHAGVTPKMKADRPVGEWNSFHIVMRGDRLTVTLNDKLIIDEAQLPGVPRKGPIALQLHAERKDGQWGASLVQFRNIRIKELTSAE